ncbi:hypothetical protein chiPu_0020432, partial [Chiloscyllium punctatum]|nr:hypothetical protein [Chiloscyllium punctatum]
MEEERVEVGGGDGEEGMGRRVEEEVDGGEDPRPKLTSAGRHHTLSGELMDRLRIIKRRLSITLRSRRPLDDSLSQLAEQISLEENNSKDNGIVHETVKVGSDGESDQISGTSSDEVQSPVGVRLRARHHQRISIEDATKRLSLPADLRLPEAYLEKFATNSAPFDKPMSRRLRRASL